jgi:hypothetical protein
MYIEGGNKPTPYSPTPSPTPYPSSAQQTGTETHGQKHFYFKLKQKIISNLKKRGTNIKI